MALLMSSAFLYFKTKLLTLIIIFVIGIFTGHKFITRYTRLGEIFSNEVAYGIYLAQTTSTNTDRKSITIT